MLNIIINYLKIIINMGNICFPEQKPKVYEVREEEPKKKRNKVIENRDEKEWNM